MRRNVIAGRIMYSGNVFVLVKEVRFCPAHKSKRGRGDVGVYSAKGGSQEKHY